MQRSLLFSITALLFSFSLLGQSSLHSHKAKVFINENTIKNLQKLGIATDHGIHKKGEYFIGDFSHEEIEKIQFAGFKMEMVLDKVIESQSRTGSIDCDLIPEEIPTYDLPFNYPYGSMAGFPTLDEMYESLDEMRSLYPNLITLRKVISSTKTHNNRSIYYVKISDNPEIDENEPEVLYTGLHHAREPLSMSQLLYFMWYVLENYDRDPSIKKLLDSRELFFVPCLNPDGYAYNQGTSPTGGGFWRKNRRDNKDGSFGIDLNRNYGYAWGFNDDGSSPLGSNDTYRGSSAFSEPETKSIKEFIEAREFQIVMNYHTWGDLLIVPWGYSEKLCEDSTLYYAMATQMTQFNHFKIGTSRATLNYSVNGTSDDWMYGDILSKKKIFAFTPEVGYAFWPDRKDILSLNQSTQYMNVVSAWNAGEAVMMKQDKSIAIDADSKSIVVNLLRTGIKDAPVQITITSDNPGIQFNKPEYIFNLLPGENQLANLDFQYAALPGLGDTIKFDIDLVCGTYTDHLTIKRIYLGHPIWNEECLNADRWFSNTNKPWISSTETYTSAPSCFTDSPNELLKANSKKEMQTVSYIDIRTAERAYLSFNTKYQMDSEAEYAQVLISTDDFNYTPLCGKYTTSGTAFQDSGNPVYTGNQKDWVREWIDISEYAGERIYLKFLISSNASVTANDGMYIDDIKVYSKFFTAVEKNDKRDMKIFPQPVENQFILQADSKIIEDIQAIELISLSGQKQKLNFEKKSNHILFHNQNQIAAGIYTLSVYSKKNKPEIHKLIFK
jgi:carboxypeptidase T